ncbi:hypothetical protein F0Z19_2792 [Vibrio cyclitrophicus]|nr:hypothetical protein F0Z19_2792 [Vibrio cyclitrophicus]
MRIESHELTKATWRKQVYLCGDVSLESIDDYDMMPPNSVKQSES